MGLCVPLFEHWIVEIPKVKSDISIYKYHGDPKTKFLVNEVTITTTHSASIIGSSDYQDVLDIQFS